VLCQKNLRGFEKFFWPLGQATANGVFRGFAEAKIVFERAFFAARNVSLLIHFEHEGR
jgi:hypothetical protein